MPKKVIREILECGRPKCIVPGCTQHGQHTGRYRKDGSVVYRAQCSGHHSLRYGIEGGYRIFKTNECANIDGRLGFKCTTNVIDKSMLDVDHIDHNHDNNNPSNLQTLCSCCHNFKTRFFDQFVGSTIKKYFKENIEFFKVNKRKDFSDRFYKIKQSKTKKRQTRVKTANRSKVN